MNRRRTISCGSVFPSSTSQTLYPTILLKRAEAFGAFAPTSSASSSLLCVVNSNHPWPATLTRRYKSRRHRRSASHHDRHETYNDSPSSPTSSISSIPCISRASLYDDDEFSSPASMSSTDLLDDLSSPQPPLPKSDMKILYALEKKSRLCTHRAQCSTCGKLGSDFPRCGKCGELWCSRSCRLRDGTKHICSKGV
ncbi:hypothetical protein L218DRAFT_688735 [Marasmius fiardii PR-910]|nr:hypothetical protein L218DRAFT_688735 [Marasmius fiardii PR-910]